MTKNTKQESTIQIGDGDIIESQPSHPVFQEFDKIQELIKTENNEKEIKKALDSYMGELDRPGFLDEAEKITISVTRRLVVNVLKNHQVSDELRNKLDRLYSILTAKEWIKEAESPEKEREFSAENEINKNNLLKIIFTFRIIDKPQKIRELTGIEIDIKKLSQIVRRALSEGLNIKIRNVPERCLDKKIIIPWIKDNVKTPMLLDNITKNIKNRLLEYKVPHVPKPNGQKKEQKPDKPDLAKPKSEARPSQQKKEGPPPPQEQGMGKPKPTTKNPEPPKIQGNETDATTTTNAERQKKLKELIEKFEKVMQDNNAVAAKNIYLEIAKIDIAEGVKLAKRLENLQQKSVETESPEKPDEKSSSETSKKIPESSDINMKNDFGEAIKLYINNRQKERKLYEDVHSLLKAESDDLLLVELQEKLKRIFNQSEAVFKKSINKIHALTDFFKGLEPWHDEIAKILVLKQNRDFYVHLGLGKIRREISRLYAILGVNPARIKTLQKRKYLEEIQEEIFAELKEIKKTYSQENLKNLRLKEKMKKAEEISKKVKGLDEFIEYFEKEILDDIEGNFKDIYRGNKPSKIQAPSHLADIGLSAEPTKKENEKKDKKEESSMIIGSQDKELKDLFKENSEKAKKTEGTAESQPSASSIISSSSPVVTSHTSTSTVNASASSNTPAPTAAPSTQIQQKIIDTEPIKTIKPLDKMGPNGISKLIKRIEDKLEEQKKLGTSDTKLANLTKQLEDVKEYNNKRFNYGAINKETGIREAVLRMLQNILIDGKLIKANLPVCRAINTLIMSSQKNVGEIENALTHPEFLKQTIDKDIMALISDEFKNLNINEGSKNAYEQLKKALEKKIQETQNKIDETKLLNKSLERQITNLQSSSKQRALEPNDKIQIKKWSDELEVNEKNILGFEREIARINKFYTSVVDLTKLEKRSEKYKSPREVLGLINIYLSKEDITIQQLAKDINKQVEDEKKKMKSSLIVNIGGRLFMSSLKSTLKAIAKDDKLQELLGKNADEELAKLSTLFGGSPEKVKEWLNQLDGKLEKHANTTVPRLISYLELAVRDGKARYISGTWNANKLIENLRSVQHEFIKNKVGEMKISDKEKMLQYVEMINEAERNIGDINKKILSRNALKSIGIKGATVAGLTAGAILSPFSFLATLPAFLSAPAFIASYTKGVPDKHRSKVRSAAIRTCVANGIVLGAAALTGPLSLPVIGVLSALGLTSPEIGKLFWKHRKYDVGKGTAGKVTKGTGKALGKGGKALGKGLVMAGTGIAVVATLPFWGPFVGIKKLKEKIFKR